MAWPIFICLTILTANNIAHGSLFRSNINSDAYKNLVHLFKREAPYDDESASVYAPIDMMLREYITPDMIAQWKYTNKPMHDILQKVYNYYNKNKRGSMSEMMESVLCQTREMKYFGGKMKGTLGDMIRSIDIKPKCSKNQQKEILGKIVKHLSLGYMLNPKNVLDFFQSDLFEVYATFMNMPDSMKSDIISIAGSLAKHNVINWKLFDTAKRFLCHLDVTDFSKITPDVLSNTMKKMMSDPKCSDDELKTKWKNLVTSFSDYIKPMVLQLTGQIAMELNTWPAKIMTQLKSIDWSRVKTTSDETVKKISQVADVIFSNIQKSSDRKWTLPDLVKNFICGMNITDFYQMDENFFNKWIPNIGNLDACNKQQEEKAWDKFVNAVAKIYVEIVNDLNKQAPIDLRMLRMSLRDSDVRLIQYGVKVIGIKKLDVAIGMIWKNLKKYRDIKLDIYYIFKFLSCHLKEDEIDSMDMSKVMKMLSTFGQPLSCTPKADYLQSTLKILWKLDFETSLEMMDEFGEFTTEDLKMIAKEAKELKDVTVASYDKISTRSNNWINYIKQNSALNMSIIATELICFVSKADYATIPKLITSIGDIGACTETERLTSTEEFLKELTNNDLDEMREFLIAIGIYTGTIDSEKLKVVVGKMLANLNKYTIEIEKMIPQELKDLTIAKVMNAITDLLKPLDDMMTCMLKAIMWLIFEQPNGPTLMECLYPDMKRDPGKNPDGNIEDRYKVGFDFPFNENPVTDKKKLVLELLEFNRKAETEKEERILRYVTKIGIDFLIDNPNDLNEFSKKGIYKKRIIEMADLVGKKFQILSKMDIKIDKGMLAEMKGDVSRKEAKNILKKALEDMEIGKKSAAEKKEIIKDIPPGLLRKSGSAVIDELYSPETRDALIERFKKEPESSQSEGGVPDYGDDGDDSSGEEEETNTLAKLTLVGKVMQNRLDKETVKTVIDSSLISAISIQIIKILPKEEVCPLKIDTTEVTTPQIEYFSENCPENVANLIRTNPAALGKIITKLPQNIIKSLTLEELVKVTAAACRYERQLGIDQETLLKKRFMELKLNLKNDGIKMGCVLKHVDPESDLSPQECQILGRSTLKKIPAERANSFKDKCLQLLIDKKITFGKMGSMNAYLATDDINRLTPDSVLQGAAVLGKHVNEQSVFDAIGKKISELNGFKDRSTFTADQVEQASIFTAAMSDTNQIPKDSIKKAFGSLAKYTDALIVRKHLCLADNRAASECNEMDPIIDKLVDLLLASTAPPPSARRKRSTVSCRCSDLVSLGSAAVQVSASDLSNMICTTNFDECMGGLSQITAWKNDQRKVFADKAIAAWGQPSSWNSTHMSVASAIIPGLTTDQINALASFSRDNAFEVGKQNNWESAKLTDTFLLFAKKQLGDDISGISSMDLQTLGNIVCGISVDNIKKIPKESYINAANQIGSLSICSEAQYTEWAKKAKEQYGDDVSQWELAQISSIGSVINGLATSDLQKLNAQQIRAITDATIAKILPSKIAILTPDQIGYLTTSQAEMVTPAQKEKMTEAQKDILKKKMVGYKNPEDNGGQRIDGTNCMKILTPLLLIASKNFVNLLSGV